MKRDMSKLAKILLFRQPNDFSNRSWDIATGISWTVVSVQILEMVVIPWSVFSIPPMLGIPRPYTYWFPRREWMGRWGLLGLWWKYVLWIIPSFPIWSASKTGFRFTRMDLFLKPVLFFHWRLMLDFRAGLQCTRHVGSNPVQPKAAS